jgi:hypothetical protein
MTKLKSGRKPGNRYPVIYKLTRSEINNMRCRCNYCKFNLRITKLLEQITDAKVKSAVFSLHDFLLHTLDDLNYKTAILDGSWPQAKDILYKAIEPFILEDIKK